MVNDEIVPGFDDCAEEKLSIFLEHFGGTKDCLCLRLSGYIDTYNAASFQKRMNRILEQGFIQLVFELSALNYMSSTGIFAFLSLLKACRERGGDVVLVGMRENTLGVFEILGFSSFFRIHGSLEEISQEAEACPVAP